MGYFFNHRSKSLHWTKFHSINAGLHGELQRRVPHQPSVNAVLSYCNGWAMDLGKKLVELYPKMLRYALSLARNKDLAEDLVMDVIARLLGRADQFEDGINIEGYAIRAVKNRFIDDRRYRVRMVTESSLGTDEENFFDGIADNRAEMETTSGLERRDLARALCATGNDCLEILTLFGVGSSYKEISERLEMAIGTVMSRMARCRSKLKIQLEEPA